MIKNYKLYYKECLFYCFNINIVIIVIIIVINTLIKYKYQYQYNSILYILKKL